MKFKILPLELKNIPPNILPMEELSIQDQQIDNMTPEEKEMQRALGLLCDWIIIVEDRKELLRRGTQCAQFNQFEDNSHHIYIVVEAINLNHAQLQVRQSNCFPEKDFRMCGEWQSNISGVYYREQYARDHYLRCYGEPRIHIL